MSLFEDDKSSLLHRATHLQELYEVKLALTCGADPNFKGLQGFTPMHIAAINGNVPILRALVEFGGDVNVAAADDKCDYDYLYSIIILTNAVESCKRTTSRETAFVWLLFQPNVKLYPLSLMKASMIVHPEVKILIEEEVKKLFVFCFAPASPFSLFI